MPAPLQTVHILDDDDNIRDSLSLYLESRGYTTARYATAGEFLENYDPEHPGCLILDLKLPSMSGLELQSRLQEQGSCLPIIFISGYGDIPSAVAALKAGAFDFLVKPYDPEQLLRRVDQALNHDQEVRTRSHHRRRMLESMRKLTRRESQVLRYIVEGKANKVIACELKLSQRTVEIYRANVMQKLEAQSLAQLVRDVTQVSNGTNPPV